MQEAQQKAASQRKDYSVGVEGDANKNMQAKPQINFGQEKQLELRMRDTNSSIGAFETKQTYAYTSDNRKKNH